MGLIIVTSLFQGNPTQCTMHATRLANYSNERLSKAPRVIRQETLHASLSTE